MYSAGHSLGGGYATILLLILRAKQQASLAASPELRHLTLQGATTFGAPLVLLEGDEQQSRKAASKLLTGCR